MKQVNNNLDIEKIFNNNDKENEKKATNTAFFLMFPALILAGMTVYFAPSLSSGMLALALAIYQFIMVKKFIEDYYKK